MKHNLTLNSILSLSLILGISTVCHASADLGNKVLIDQEPTFSKEKENLHIGIDLIQGGSEKVEDFEKGVQLLEELGKAGYGEAYSALGWCYLNGQHLGPDRVWVINGYENFVKEIDFEKAHSFFEKAALLGDKDGKTESEKHPNILLSRANQGDSDAQVLLGTAYLHAAPGFKKNIQEAIRWFETSQGESTSCVNLGRIYRGVFDGFEGVDHKKAVEWFHKAEKMRDGHACFYLSLHYANGDGVPQDRKRAANYAEGARQYWIGGSLEILRALVTTPDDQRIENPRKDAVMVWRKPVPALGKGDRF